MAGGGEGFLALFGALTEWYFTQDRTLDCKTTEDLDHPLEHFIRSPFVFAFQYLAYTGTVGVSEHPTDGSLAMFGDFFTEQLHRVGIGHSAPPSIFAQTTRFRLGS